MKNHRIFEVYYLRPTNTKGFRLKINDLRHRSSVTISQKHDNTFDMDAKDSAEFYLSQLGITIIGFGEGKRGFILFTDNFHTSINT